MAVVKIRALSPDNDRDILNLLSLVEECSSSYSNKLVAKKEYWRSHIGSVFISLVAEIDGEILAHTALRTRASARDVGFIFHRLESNAAEDFRGEIRSELAAAIKRIATMHKVPFILAPGNTEQETDRPAEDTCLQFTKLCRMPPLDQKHQPLNRASRISIWGAKITQRSASEIYLPRIYEDEIRRLYKSIGETPTVLQSVPTVSDPSIRTELALNRDSSETNPIYKSILFLPKSLSESSLRKILKDLRGRDRTSTLFLDMAQAYWPTIASAIESYGGVFSGILPAFRGQDSAVFVVNASSVEIFSSGDRHNHLSGIHQIPGDVHVGAQVQK